MKPLVEDGVAQDGRALTADKLLPMEKEIPVHLENAVHLAPHRQEDGQHHVQFLGNSTLYPGDGQQAGFNPDVGTSGEDDASVAGSCDKRNNSPSRPTLPRKVANCPRQSGS